MQCRASYLFAISAFGGSYPAQCTVSHCHHQQQESSINQRLRRPKHLFCCTGTALSVCFLSWHLCCSGCCKSRIPLDLEGSRRTWWLGWSGACFGDYDCTLPFGWSKLDICCRVDSNPTISFDIRILRYSDRAKLYAIFELFLA